MPFTLVTIPFTQATPGILDPPNIGPLMAPLPAGAQVEVSLLCTTPPDQPSLFSVYLSADGINPDASLGNWRNNSNTYIPANALGSFWDGATDLYPANGAGNHSGQAVLPSGVYLSLFSDATPPTVFSGTLVIKIYS